ncbi:hypothetical protein [Candidatus Entotheonella palauensis]|nr:hypothetical protein [Candidatus Entotheonella palauensis]
MLDYDFIWDEEPGGNVDHIAEHDLTPEDVIYAFHHVERYTTSRSSGLPALIGETPEGDLMFVAYTEIDVTTVYVRTAYRI